eukprot:TRINITY_DN6020_c0_g3_i2.p3 TRINITY_DN6020_c0_g3~~TRINITY_DN6020_c0_g3_i2.p3  ORF type:complete len:102 (+),score=18.82 TRINITY_DN6020_c0_g3_i2:138-443(+)
MVERFVSLAADGRHQDAGYPSSAYGLSKTALSAYTRILAQQLAPRNIHVSAMCPGWCRTSMAGDKAPRTAAEGADTAVWLASDAGERPSGRFWADREEISW